MDGFYPLPEQSAIRPTVPNTEIWICGNIPWDSDYNHVRNFGTEAALREYLKSMSPSSGEPWHIQQMSPIGFGEARVRLPKQETQLMGANYMMFINHNIAERYFYAFITSIDWLSDNSCLIHYELDYYQCCAYRAQYKPCFVVREHVPVANDTFGGNLIPENLETGEMVCNKSNQLGFGSLSIGMLLTETLDGKQVQGRIVGAVYQGANLTILQNDDPEVPMETLANGLLSNYNDKGKIDAIVDVFMIPELCRQQGTQTITINGGDSFQGYAPKNNKLYSFPYCYCLVDNNIGTTAKFKFEYSTQKNNTVEFSARGELCPLPAVSLRTNNYEINGINYLHAMSYTGFPQCSWNSDVYRAWAAQNKNTIALSTATNALQPVKAGITGAIAGALAGGLPGAVAGGVTGTIGGAVSGFENQAKLMAASMDKEIEPAQIHGKCDSLNLNASLGMMRFNFYNMSCTYQNAKAVDDFFTMYGYAVNQVKIPEMNSRPSWNFVKTSGCGFTGELPPDMLRNFRAIFDRGVTIWHTDDIGNYGLNNR